MKMTTINFNKIINYGKNSGKFTFLDFVFHFMIETKVKDFLSINDEIFNCYVNDINVKINENQKNYNLEIDKEIRKIEKMKKRYPFLSIGTIIQNIYGENLDENENELECEHFIELILIGQNLLFLNENENYEIIKKYIPSGSFLLSSKYNQSISDIIIKYQEKKYETNDLYKIKNDIINVGYENLNLYLSTYLFFSSIMKNKLVKEFLNDINSIPNYDFDFLKETFKKEFFRTKCKTEENDNMFLNIKQKIF